MKPFALIVLCAATATIAAPMPANAVQPVETDEMKATAPVTNNAVVAPKSPDAVTPSKGDDNSKPNLLAKPPPVKNNSASGSKKPEPVNTDDKSYGYDERNNDRSSDSGSANPTSGRGTFNQDNTGSGGRGNQNYNNGGNQNYNNGGNPNYNNGGNQNYNNGGNPNYNNGGNQNYNNGGNPNYNNGGNQNYNNRGNQNYNNGGNQGQAGQQGSSKSQIFGNIAGGIAGGLFRGLAGGVPVWK